MSDAAEQLARQFIESHGVDVTPDELAKITSEVRRQLARPLSEQTPADRARIAAAQAKRDRRKHRNQKDTAPC